MANLTHRDLQYGDQPYYAYSLEIMFDHQAGVMLVKSGRTELVLSAGSDAVLSSLTRIIYPLHRYFIADEHCVFYQNEQYGIFFSDAASMQEFAQYCAQEMIIRAEEETDSFFTSLQARSEAAQANPLSAIRPDQLGDEILKQLRNL